MLQSLDFIVGKFDDLAGLDAHHVIVMLAVVEFEYRMSALEIVARHEPGRLELGQHTVNGRQADILPRIEQFLVHVLGAHVALFGVLENLEDFQTRQGDLEAGIS